MVDNMKIRKGMFWRLVIIHLIIIIILTCLIVKIKVEGDKYDCEKCQITFYESLGYQPNAKVRNNFTVNLTELYVGYNLNECPISWDKDQGYIGSKY